MTAGGLFWPVTLFSDCNYKYQRGTNIFLFVILEGIVEFAVWAGVIKKPGSESTALPGNVLNLHRD